MGSLVFTWFLLRPLPRLGTVVGAALLILLAIRACHGHREAQRFAIIRDSGTVPGPQWLVLSWWAVGATTAALVSLVIQSPALLLALCFLPGILAWSVGRLQRLLATRTSWQQKTWWYQALQDAPTAHGIDADELARGTRGLDQQAIEGIVADCRQRLNLESSALIPRPLEQFDLEAGVVRSRLEQHWARRRLKS